MPTPFAALPALRAPWVAANGVPLRDPLKPMPPALDHATTLPSVSVIVTVVLLNDAWMCARPWWTMRFSPRFLNVFFSLPAPSFFSGFSGVGPAAAGADLAIFFLLLDRLRLCDRPLAQAPPPTRVCSSPLAVHRQP